jgi:hypothetical protein
VKPFTSVPRDYEVPRAFLAGHRLPLRWWPQGQD